jgi:hypothetical protein
VPELDIRGILAELTREGVEFLIIGGVAVGFHGYVRATKDVDIVPAPDPQNLERLTQVLADSTPRSKEPRTLRTRSFQIRWTRNVCAKRAARSRTSAFASSLPLDLGESRDVVQVPGAPGCALHPDQVIQRDDRDFGAIQIDNQRSLAHLIERTSSLGFLEDGDLTAPRIQSVLSAIHRTSFELA